MCPEPERGLSPAGRGPSGRSIWGAPLGQTGALGQAWALCSEGRLTSCVPTGRCGSGPWDAHLAVGRLCPWQVFLPASECFSRCLLSPGSVRFLGGASAGWAARAHRPGRNQPGRGWSHPRAAPVWSGRSSAVSGDSAASAPGLVACKRASGMWPCLVSPCAAAQLFALALASPQLPFCVALAFGRGGSGRDARPRPRRLSTRGRDVPFGSSLLGESAACTLTSFPVARFPREPRPRGISWKVKGREARGFPGSPENVPSDPLSRAWAGSSGAQAADRVSGTSGAAGTLVRPLLSTKPARAFLGTSASPKAKEGLRGGSGDCQVSVSLVVLPPRRSPGSRVTRRPLRGAAVAVLWDWNVMALASPAGVEGAPA